MQINARENSVLKGRILQYLDYKGVSKYECYQNTGITNGVLSQKSGISEDNILKFLSYYNDINTEWLLTGKGDMLNHIQGSVMLDTRITPKDEEKKLKDAADYQSAVKPVSKPIHLYDVSAAAGYSNFTEMISSETVVGTYIVPDFRNVDWMIYVKGSSMYPKYSSGDIIACRVLYESQFIQWNKVYVIATREQGILVKRIDESDRPDCLLAISDNPSYKPFYIPKDEILGIALVVGVIRME